jgi:uncharacterized damage-inducible protein DinB
MKSHFQSLAAYGAWANDRLLSDAALVSREDLHRDVGVYFKSLFATLIHYLQSDRAWTFLLQGGALSHMKLEPAPTTLAALRRARGAQDAAFCAWIDTLDEAWYDQPFTFVSALGSMKGSTYHGTNRSTLTHVINHQTHHRGQAHAALTILGVAEPKPLDILVKGFLEA